MDISNSLKAYIESYIVPVYKSFDKGHDMSHINKVIDDSLVIAQDYDVDLNMVYTIAAYHDIGIPQGRENHHITSGVILKNDEKLRQWFSEEQIKIMQEAVEDHRASNRHEPRSIYGKIVAEADRDISVNKIVYRSIAYALKNYPNEEYETMQNRVYTHIQTKYGEKGYLKLWLNTEKNRRGLQEVQNVIRNKDNYKNLFKEIFDNSFKN